MDDKRLLFFLKSSVEHTAQCFERVDVFGDVSRPAIKPDAPVYENVAAVVGWYQEYCRLYAYTIAGMKRDYWQTVLEGFECQPDTYEKGKKEADAQHELKRWQTIVDSFEASNLPVDQ